MTGVFHAAILSRVHVNRPILQTVVKVKSKSADIRLMGVLDRYQKKGGFSQLLLLLDSSSTKKQEHLLTVIGEENPLWEAALRKRLITLSRLEKFETPYFFEIISKIPEDLIAYSLCGEPQEKLDQWLNCFPSYTKKRIEILMAELRPSPSEKEARILKLICCARDLLSQNCIPLAKVDPDLIIENNIEELLNRKETTPGNSKVPKEKNDLNPQLATVTDSPKQSSDHEPDHELKLVELKIRVTQLISEINNLRAENTQLKAELNQYKKSA